MSDDSKNSNQPQVAFIEYDKVKLYPEGSIKLTGASTRDYVTRAGDFNFFLISLYFE